MTISTCLPVLLLLLSSTFSPALTAPLQGEEEGVSDESVAMPVSEKEAEVGMVPPLDQTVGMSDPVVHMAEVQPQESNLMTDQMQLGSSPLQADGTVNQDRSKRHLYKKKWGGGWGGKAWGGGGYGGGYGGGGYGGGGHGGWGGGGLQISKVVVIPVKVVSGGGGHGGWGGGGYGGGGYGGGYGGGSHGGGGYGGGQGGWGGSGHGGYGGGGCHGGCGGGHGGGGSYSWSHASASSGSGSWGKKR